MEEAKRIRVRKADGIYEYNADIEHQTSWGKKMDKLEEQYGRDMPKIVFHSLDDAGNLKCMQLKRDRVWNTLGWSAIGNVAGVGVVRYIEKSSDKYKNLKHF